MEVKLSKEEANNVVVALITLSKASDVPVNVMKALINLSDKFQWVGSEPAKEIKEEELKAVPEPVKEEKKPNFTT